MPLDGQSMAIPVKDGPRCPQPTPTPRSLASPASAKHRRALVRFAHLRPARDADQDSTADGKITLIYVLPDR
jgi:hypothetical protein